MSKSSVILEWNKASVALPLLIALLCPAASAQVPPKDSKERQKFAYCAEMDFNSSYVWRGIAFNSEPVAQPWGCISAYGLTLTAWTNLNLTETSESAHLRTTNLALTYSHDWKKLRIEPAIEAYLNRRQEGIDDPNTMEGSLNLSYPAGLLRVFTIHSFDVLAYKGSYFGEAGLGYEGHVTKRATLRVSFHSGWASSTFNDVYIGLGKPAFNFIGAEGSLTYYPRPNLYFRPHMELSRIVDRRLRESLSSSSILNFGLAVGVEF